MKEEINKVNPIVENLNKIQITNEMTKSDFAFKIGFPESKWNKISNGKQELTVTELSNIARKLDMREIDILTYPDEYNKPNKEEDDIKVTVSLEIRNNVKEKVLKEVFGNQDITILNKEY